jgi:hypothetical protein
MKLSRDDLIPECLAGLSYAKRDLHSPRFLNIQKIYKDSLGCFRPQVNHISVNRKTLPISVLNIKLNWRISVQLAVLLTPHFNFIVFN